MQTIQDFVSWAGGTRKAARQLGISAPRMSRIKTGKQPVTPEIAQRVESVTQGLFRKERILWPQSKAA